MAASAMAATAPIRPISAAASGLIGIPFFCRPARAGVTRAPLGPANGVYSMWPCQARPLWVENSSVLRRTAWTSTPRPASTMLSALANSSSRLAATAVSGESKPMLAAMSLNAASTATDA